MSDIHRNPRFSTEAAAGTYTIEWLTLGVCSLVFAAVILATALILSLSSNVSFVSGLLLGIIPAAVVFVLLNSVRKAAKKRYTADWQMGVEVRESGQWVSNRMVDRYRHVLTDSQGEGSLREDCIHLITRFHVASLAAHVARQTETGFLPFLKAIGGVIGALLLFVAAQAGLIYAGAGGYIPWWVVLLAELIIAASAWLATVKWRYTVFILTNLNAHLVFRPPLFLEPLMRGFQPVLALRTVNDWDKEESRLAKFFGMDYATLIIDSPSDKDAWANNLRFMKHPEQVLPLVGSLVQAMQNRMSVQVIQTPVET